MPRPLNILLIMTDQQRADSLGYTHSGPTFTPTLDALAAEGVVFESAYASSTSCVPSRSSLMTGFLPHRLPVVPGGLALPEGHWTIARAFKQAGYRTGLFGKMHFDPIRADHGFDVMRTCEHLTKSAGYGRGVTDDYRTWLADQGLKDLRFRNSPGKPRTFPYDAQYHPTKWVTREAGPFLQQRGRPYFAVVSYPHPHTPYDPPEPYDTMYRPEDIQIPGSGIEVNDDLPASFLQAVYADPGQFFGPKRVDMIPELLLRRTLATIRGLVRMIDDSVADLMRHVDLADTLVIFLSDHGDYGGHRGFLGKIPWIPFEDLIRVPFFCVGAGVAAGRRIRAPVRAFDFVPTVLEAAGVPRPRVAFDAYSLLPILGGNADGIDEPVITATSQGWPTIRRAAYKHIWHPYSDAHALYDLDADPGETHNLATDPLHAALLRQNAEVLVRVLAKQAPNLWLGPSDHSDDGTVRRIRKADATSE